MMQMDGIGRLGKANTFSCQRLRESPAEQRGGGGGFASQMVHCFRAKSPASRFVKNPNLEYVDGIFF